MNLSNPNPSSFQRTYEVIVAGGGLGGVASAIAAARCGAKTLIIERNGFLGGTATAGMCCSMFNCFFTSRGALGCPGIPLDVADALAEATGYGGEWRRHKGHLIYDIEKAKLTLEAMLLDARVDILLNSWIIDALVNEEILEGVIAHGKSGPLRLKASVVVDATGGADVAALAGAPVHVAEHGKHSLCFRMGNVDVDAFVDHFRAVPEDYPAPMDVNWTLDDALAQYDACGTFLFPHGGGMQMKAFKVAREAGDLPDRVGVHDTLDACQMHALRNTGMVHVITGFTHFDGLDSWKLSSGILDGRRMAFAVAAVYRKYIPGFSRSFVAGTANNLGVRISRWIDGEFVFTADMMKAGLSPKDTVGRAVAWDPKVLYPKEGAWSAQVMRESPFGLPYGCLLPQGVEGLLMGAGRSVSTDNPWLLRVMVHTMVVGQAAGTAAAVAAKGGVPPRELDVADIQAALGKLGAL